MFAEIVSDFKKMNRWELMMSAFIIAVSALYIYDITKLTVDSVHMECRPICQPVSP